MKSLKRPLSLLLLALLSACASDRFTAATRASAPAAAASSDASAPADEFSSTNAHLPKVALTPELVFGVLASEIAAQRGAVGSAALTDLDLARQTRDPRLAERATQFGLASGNMPVATDALALWLQLDPDSIPAREQLIVVNLRNGQLAASQPMIEDLLRRQPGQASIMFVQLARLVETQQDKPAAFRMINTLVAPYPDLPEARFALLVAAAETGNDAVVSAEFDRLARLAPQWDLPVAWQAERLRKLDLNSAIVFLKKELARRPAASLDLKMAYPRLLVGAKRFEEARQGFEALLAEHPRQPELLYATGLLAFQLNDLDTARRELQGALDEHYPDTDFLRYSLGQICENQHDLKAASQWYLQVAPGPQYLPAQVRQAFIEAQNGQLDGAMARLAQLGTTDAERIQLVLIQSEFAREAKRYDLGLTVLTKALIRFPRNPDLLYERSLIYDLKNQPAAAERDLRVVLKLRPDDDQSLNALGYVLANRTTRYPEAYSLIQKALKLAPDNPMILDSMGWVLYKMGRLDEGLKYLEKAYAALPDEEIAAHYGEVLWKLGRQQEARALWSKAIQASAEHPRVDETMHRLLVQ